MCFMELTVSKFRQNIYRILDDIIRTGKPAEIVRNGSLLRIVAVEKKFSKSSRLKKQKLGNEDSLNFVHIDWMNERKT